MTGFLLIFIQWRSNKWPGFSILFIGNGKVAKLHLILIILKWKRLNYSQIFHWRWKNDKTFPNYPFLVFIMNRIDENLFLLKRKPTVLHKCNLVMLLLLKLNVIGSRPTIFLEKKTCKMKKSLYKDDHSNNKK